MSPAVASVAVTAKSKKMIGTRRIISSFLVRNVDSTRAKVLGGQLVGFTVNKDPHFPVIDHPNGDHDFVVQARVDACFQWFVADDLRHGNENWLLPFGA